MNYYIMKIKQSYKNKNNNKNNLIRQKKMKIYFLHKWKMI